MTENQSMNKGQPESAPCPSCQHRNRPGARFCSRCGANLAKAEKPIPAAPLPVQPPSAPLASASVTGAGASVIPIQPAPACPRCLLPNPPDAGVCTHCGKELIPFKAVASQPAAAPAVSLTRAGDSGKTCPACGLINSEVVLSCRSCGYSFTYRQEATGRPEPPVNILESIGILVALFVFCILIGIASYYLFVAAR